MSVTKEEQLYNQAMQNVPQTVISNDTLNSQSALAGAENTTAPNNYSGSWQAKLDAEIGEWLNSKGFNYNTSNDENYQQYAQQYKQNAETGRQQSLQNANTLANGYTPTYANTVANEVYNGQMENLSDNAGAFRSLAAQEYQGAQNQAANGVNIYNTLDSIDYNRNRDDVADYKNYINYLYDRYSADKQNDANLDSVNADVYGTLLSGAQSNLSDARNIDNARYQYDTQSADNAAQIAESNYENEQKINYNKAKDAYDVKIALAKEAAKNTPENKGKTENANAILKSMGVSKDDFAAETDTKDAGKLYDENGAVNYTIYAKTYIGNALQKGQINSDERAYLYNKLGITSDGSKYNSEIADGYINTFKLNDNKQSDEYKLTQIERGHNMGTLSSADVAYCIATLGLNL